MLIETLLAIPNTLVFVETTQIPCSGTQREYSQADIAPRLITCHLKFHETVQQSLIRPTRKAISYYFDLELPDLLETSLPRYRIKGAFIMKLVR